MDDSTEQVPPAPGRHRLREQRAIDQLWDFGDAARSEERFREAADLAEGAHERGVMATQLARAIGIQGRADEALAVLDVVEASLSEGEGAAVGGDGAHVDPEADASPAAAGSEAEAAELRSRIDLERGRLLAALGRADDAVAALTRAVREAVAAGSTFLALDGVHMLALDDVGHEAEWAEQGFALLEAERDPRVLRWGVALHNNLGWTLHDAGDAEGGLREFERAVEAADHYGTPEQRHVARWATGRALRTLGRTEEALAVQQALAAARPDDPYVIAEIAALTEAGPTIEA
ncbi:hypothetical protein ACDF64_16300 [Agromyces sp. MMS24-JH15]|uniref:hypothetical protein n=1 Tax=Agromyces sp. MMS24-JH15 TaxID=3243765 RepID=UPI00374892A7